MKKLIVASMLAAFAAAVALPVVAGSDVAFAAGKKKPSNVLKHKQKKPPHNKM